jgi:hypothetical protein
MTAGPLDPNPDPRDSPDSPQDDEPSTLSTPEGDNEASPDAPLDPDSTDADLEGLQIPRGSKA